MNEAEQLQVQDLNMRKKLHGAEHPITLAAMENLARTYHVQGRLNEAVQLEIQVLEIRKRLLDAENSDTFFFTTEN